MDIAEVSTDGTPPTAFFIEIPEASTDVTTEVFYTSADIPVLFDNSSDKNPKQQSETSLSASTSMELNDLPPPAPPPVSPSSLSSSKSRSIKASDLPTLKVCLTPVSVPNESVKLAAKSVTTSGPTKRPRSVSTKSNLLKTKRLKTAPSARQPENETPSSQPINLPAEAASPGNSKRGYSDDVAGKCFVLDCPVRKKPSLDVRNRKLPMSLLGFERGRQWLTNAGRTDLLARYSSDPNSMRHYSICDLHFADNQFMNPLRRLTIPNAMPTLFGKDAIPYSYYVMKQKEGLEWYERTVKQSKVNTSNNANSSNAKTLPRPLATPIKPAFFVNKDPNHFTTILSEALVSQDYADTVIACPNLRIRVHRVVLAAGSPYFKDFLSQPPFADMDEPCIILDEFTPWELQTLVYYLYHGSISVPHDKVEEVKKFLEKFLIGQVDLPPAPPIYKDCLDMPIRFSETNAMQQPNLPFKPGNRKVYGYAGSELSSTTSRIGFKFLEKIILKNSFNHRVLQYKPKSRPFMEEISLDEDTEEELTPETVLFDDVREVDYPLPSLELDFKVLDRHDLYELDNADHQEPLNDQVGDGVDITADPEVAVLLDEFYNFEYVSPYITALIRKGYPSKRSSKKIHLLTNAPVAKHYLSKGSNREKVLLQARRKAEQRKAQSAVKKAFRAVAKGKQKLLKRRFAAVRTNDEGGEAEEDEEGDGEMNTGDASAGRRKKNYKVPNGFICEFCGKTFNYRANLVAHLRIHRGELPYRCETCGKGFRMKKVLRVHEDGHMGIRNFKCDLCDRRFLRKDQMAKHRRVHTGEKPYICHICGKRFRVKGGLNNHVRTHTKEKPFSCQICSMNFSSHRTVNEHKENHTQEDRNLRDPTFFYKCENCGYYFCRPSQVMKHKCDSRGADDEGDFWCQQCPKRFISEEFAQQHFEQAHVKKTKHNSKEEICQTCSIIFPSLGDLLKHAKDLHIGQKEAEVYCNADGLYPCQTCDAVLETEELWREHRKTHEETREPSGCATCGKMFKSKAALSRHAITHLEVKPHMCTMCDKSFTTKQMLTNHMNSHLKIKPYVCEWCGHAFSSQGNYYKHKYRHLGVRKCKYCHRIFDTNKKLHEHETAHEAGKVTGSFRKQQMDVVVVPAGVVEPETSNDGESVEEDDASNYYVVLDTDTLYKTA